MALLSLDAVSRRQRASRRELTVLDAATLSVEQGEYVGIRGGARSGKSTLLRLAAGIERPDAGVVRFDGRDLATLSNGQRALLLRREIGYVSTSVALERGWRPGERILDAVALPLLGDGWSRDDALVAAQRWLDRMGVGGCADAALGELSAGERTQVALARALVREPRLLLVDEPALTTTPTERDQIRKLLRELGERGDRALIVASEDVSVLRGARTALSIAGGRLRSSSESSSTVVAFPFERAGRGRSTAP